MHREKQMEIRVGTQPGTIRYMRHYHRNQSASLLIHSHSNNIQHVDSIVPAILLKVRWIPSRPCSFNSDVISCFVQILHATSGDPYHSLLQMCLSPMGWSHQFHPDHPNPCRPYSTKILAICYACAPDQSPT